MTTDQVIALSASVAAALSAFATFLTVREMKQQRQLVHRPDLVVLPVALKATVEASDGVAVERAVPAVPEGLPIHWEGKSGRDLVSSGPFIAAAISNIGVGGAKGIEATWSAPIESFSADINAMAQRALTPAFYEYRSERLTFKSESLGGMTMMWGNTKTQHLDFVLPASTQGSSVALSIPFAFLHLISAYIHVFTRLDKDSRPQFSIPPLSLTLAFTDIASVEHRQTFSGTFDPISFSGTAFTGRLVFRRTETPR